VKKILFAFLLSINFIFTLFAQKNIVKGYIVTNTGDTLKGTINNKDWLKNPAYILFKSDLNSKIEKRTPLQIKSFSVSDKGDIYESHKVSIDLSPHIEMNIFSLDNTADMKVVVPDTTLFLSVLVRGNATLYHFFDANAKPHYYYSKKGENDINELILQKATYYKNNVQFIGEDKKYLTQLTVLSDCKELQDFSNVSFSSNSLSTVFSKYNQCVGNKSSNIIRSDKSSNFFFVMAGGSFTNIKFRGIPEIEKNVFPILGIGMDFVLPRNRNKWSLGIETWLQSAGRVNYSYANFIKINGLIKYKILVNQSLNPYLTTGYGINIILKDNVYSPSPGILNTSGFLGGLGIIKNRWSAEIRAESVASVSNWVFGAINGYNYNVFLRYQINSNR
jgi:hypothetical protein